MAVVPLQHRFDGPRTAPVVVLVPTLGAKWSVWEPQMPELTRRLRVLRVNHRGHGSSPAPPGPYSVPELGGDLLALLDRYELEQVSFIGVGLGAMVALWTAAAAPSRTTRLALVSTTAWTPPSPRWQNIGERVRRFGVASVSDEVTRSWFTPGFCERRPDIAERFLEEFEQTSPEGYAGCCDAVANVDHRPLARRVHAPTVVISGAHDPQTPPGHGRRLTGLLPNARFEVVCGAAHLANVERADLVNDLLLRHLAPAAVPWP